MKKYTVATLLMVGMIFGTVSAQSAADLEARLGTPTKSYGVGEFVWMTPEFAADGQVCRMRFYPRHVAANTNIVARDLPLDNFRTAIEQLVPMSVRGARKNIPEDVAWATGGGVIWAIFTFERVRIMYMNSFKVDPDFKLVRGEFKFPLEDIPSEAELAAIAAKPKPPETEFRDSPVVMASVTWTDRKCVGD